MRLMRRLWRGITRIATPIFVAVARTPGFYRTSAILPDEDMVPRKGPNRQRKRCQGH